MNAPQRPRRAGNELLQRLIDFAARVGTVVESLPDTRLGRYVAGQLVRCGTAGAPNYAEACGAESRNDFVHKLGVCLKELRESQCWLHLLVRSDLLPESRLADLLDENDQLIAILVKSVTTAKGRKDSDHQTA